MVGQLCGVSACLPLSVSGGEFFGQGKLPPNIFVVVEKLRVGLGDIYYSAAWGNFPFFFPGDVLTRGG